MTHLRIAALASSFCLCALTLASVDSDVKNAHSQFEKAMLAGNKKAAVKVITDYFTSDFVYKPKGRATMDRAAFIREMTPAGELTFKKFHFTIGKITQKGNTATVSVNTSVEFTAKDKSGTHKGVGSSTDVETWVKSGSAWKMKSMQTTSEKQTIDGKPIG